VYDNSIMSTEMIFIFLLALILFGPKKLPEIGRQIGNFMAEFKRASSTFQSQIQSEIEKAGVDVGPLSRPGAQQSSSFAQPQQSSSFTQTLLPPAVKSVLSGIDDAHERLMQTARMAFDAQNFTLQSPEAPVVASAAPESLSAPLPVNPPAEASTPAAQVGAVAAPHGASPVEAATDQPTTDSAPVKSDSALQSS